MQEAIVFSSLLYIEIIMKILHLLKIIVLSALALSAFFLLAAVFSFAIRKIPARETYYRIPENHLYIKKSGNTIFFYKTQDSASSLFPLSTFLIKNNRFTSEILFPIENQYSNRTYVIDYHNCLSSSGYNTIWLTEKNTPVETPQCVSIELPISRGVLNYRLPNGTFLKALRLNKTEIKKLKIIKRVNHSDFMDILPSDTATGTIEDAEIHTTKSSTGTILLHIRDNCLECDCKTLERGGWLYPSFYYSPSYPNYIFCNNGDLIVHRRCDDILLVCGLWNPSYFTSHEGLKNWFCITLDPLTIKQME